MRLSGNFPPLCEVLDGKNRPFLLADYQLAQTQGLRHRAFAILLRHAAKYILRRNANGFGFFCHSFLPANLTAPEAAGLEISRAFAGVSAACSVFAQLPPSPRTGNGFTEFCHADLPKTAALEFESDAAWLILAASELRALRGEGLFEPLLETVLDLGFCK